MPIIFYQIPPSPPCRAVLMTADHLGIELVSKHVDLWNGDHMKPEFLEMNPQHSVPTIDDDGFYLWESRAIQTYLINQYAPDSSLYPKDPKQRATVDKVLHFDNGHIFNSLIAYLHPQIKKQLPPDPEKEENFRKSVAIFEKFLEKTPYAAGDHLTLADYSVLSNLVLAEEVLDYSYADFPKISAWLQRLKKEIPKYKEINEIPLKELKDFLKSKK